MYFQKHYPKGDFLSENFPKVRLGLLRHRRTQCGPSTAAREPRAVDKTGKGPSTAAREPRAADKIG